MEKNQTGNDESSKTLSGKAKSGWRAELSGQILQI